MAAAAVTIGVTVLNDLIALIPGAIDVANAVKALVTKNPGMTQAQINAVMSSITETVQALGADEVSALNEIKP